MNVIWKDLLNQASNMNFDLNSFEFENINAVIPLSNYGVVRISGMDAEKFLQGQTTNDVSMLEDGTWQLTCCCNQQGRIIAVVWLAKQQQNYLGIVESTAVPLLLSELKKFALFSKVVIELDPNLFVLGSIGETSPHLETNALFQLIYPEKLPKQKFLIYTTEKLAEIPQELSLAPISLWQLLNIRRGIGEIFGITQLQFTPHQLNMPALNAINFKKGCYRGQEIVARMHYLGKLKQKLYQVKIYSYTNYPRAIGSTIFNPTEKPLGTFVNVIALTKQQYLGLAVLPTTTANIIRINHIGFLKIQELNTSHE